MAYEIPGDGLGTLKAAADLSADQYRLVKVDGNGAVALCSAAGEMPAGVLQNDPDTGEVCSLMTSGVSKVVYGGTVNEGDPLKTDATGKAVAATKSTVNTSDTGAASDPVVGSYVIGVALEAGASGETGTILITHAGAVATTAA